MEELKFNLLLAAENWFCKMKYPEKYIQRGRFVLHSGQKTDILYDVNALLTDDFYAKYVVSMIPDNGHYVGITTGGALIAAMVWESRPFSRFSMIKDGRLKGEIPSGEYLLIDDVTTTEASLREAIGTIEKKPSEIIVCMDRRLEDKTLKVNSIFEV